MMIGSGAAGCRRPGKGSGGEGEEFDDREDGMKTAHGFREFETIRAVSDRGFNLKRSKADAVEFSCSLDWSGYPMHPKEPCPRAQRPEPGRVVDCSTRAYSS